MTIHTFVDPQTVYTGDPLRIISSPNCLIGHAKGGRIRVSIGRCVMQQNKVVIQLKNGTVRKGVTNDFLPNKTRFHFTGMDGSTEAVDIDTLKALFFVKDIDGNKDYKETYNDTIQGGGRKIRVEFADGEVIIGYVLGYSPDRQGFIMSPADLKGNNDRIFIVTSATRNVAFI